MMNTSDKIRFDLRPPEMFSTPRCRPWELPDVISQGMQWTTYGIRKCYLEKQIEAIAALSGRLPSTNRKHYVEHHMRYGSLTMNPRDDRKTGKRLLWDGISQNDDGLFRTEELNIVKAESSNNPHTLGELTFECNFDEPVSEESSFRIANLIATHIVTLTRNFKIGSTNVDALYPTATIGTDELSFTMGWENCEIIRALTCGYRSMIYHDDNIVLTYEPYDATEFDYLLNGAYIIARSGAAGETARSLCELSGDELIGCMRIWERFEGMRAIEEAKIDWWHFLFGDQGAGIEASGVEPFIDSFLNEGIPLDDILA